MKKAIKNCQKINDELRDENEELKKSIEDCLNSNDELRNENEEIKESINNIQNINSQIQNENTEIKEVIEGCLNENEELRKHISKLQKKLLGINKSTSSDINELKEAIIKENIQIDNFNNFSLHRQQNIINNVIKKLKDDLANPFFIQIKSFYDFVVQLNRNDIPRGLLFFQRSDNENQILIQSNITEILFIVNALNSRPFISFLNMTYNVSIEVEFPSNWYKKAIDIIESLDINVPFAAFITDANNIESFENSNLINSLRFGSNVTELPDCSGIFKRGPSFSFFRSLKQVELPRSLSIGPSFRDCGSIKKIIIPPTVVTIKNDAFRDCKSLTQIEIPPTVNEIGDYAFANCSSLIRIEIPQSVRNIGEYAFAFCRSLTYVKIPLFRRVGKYVFYDCNSVQTADIPRGFNETKKLSFSSNTHIYYY